MAKLHLVIRLRDRLMAQDTPFGRGTRMRVLAEYFQRAGPVTELNAWEHVYRCLLWFDMGARLAHIYDSNHMQSGGTFHSRAVRFTDLLCSHWKIKRGELSARLDVLFKGCVAELQRREAEKAMRAAATIEDEDAVEIDSEVESELTIAIKALLQDEGVGNNRATALAEKIEGLSRHFFTIGKKRQNALGEGFEDLLMLLLLRVSKIPEARIALRTPVSQLPGFLKVLPARQGEKAKRKREPRPDIAIIDPHITHLITTAKWSIRQDRETQFQSEYSSYQMNKSQPTELRYALITNEFDLARLRNVLRAMPGGTGGYIFHDVYHVCLPMLRETHGAGFKDFEPFVQIGKLKSLSDYLIEMRGRYGTT
jgi:hypothetical protein